MNERPYYPPLNRKEVNLKEEIRKYTRFWPWFIIVPALAVTLAYFYLKYAIPVYQSRATVIIRNDEQGQSGNDISSYMDISQLTTMNTNSIENELGLLRSKRLMINSVKALNLNVEYSIIDKLKRKVQVYDKSPIELNILRLNNAELAKARQDGSGVLIIDKVKSGLSIQQGEKGKTIKTDYGDPVKLEYVDFIIQENPDASSDITFPIVVDFKPVESVAGTYSGKLNVELLEKNSTLIGLNIEDPVRKKGEDILNQIIIEYNREALEDKNQIVESTGRFIQERLNHIEGNLESVESNKETFKESNRLTNIEAEAALNLENASEYAKKQQQVETQLELANAMVGYVGDSKKTDLMPSNLGINEAGVNENISQYNQLVLERNRLLDGSTEKNPVVKKLTKQIDQLKSNMMSSLQTRQQNLRIMRNDLRRQSGMIRSQISAVPSQEREYREIERQQSIKEGLYMYLLRKLEENELSKKLTATKAKIVDNAYSGGAPVSPNNKVVYAFSVLAGLTIPFFLIFIGNSMDSKVHKWEDIERVLPKTPILGEVPHIKGKNKDLIKVNDRSVLAETFRILVANMQYMLVDEGKHDKGISMFVTSTVSGEGKTFTAMNLALTLLNTGKKVAVVGADLRNPQLHRYDRDSRGKKGVSNFLTDANVTLDDIITESRINENLDLLPSGEILSNPSELLTKVRIAKLFEELRERYDYIIVDTAPTILVADTFLINRHADYTVYLVRAEFTDKKLLNFVRDSRENGKLKNFGVLLNDVKTNNFGYGNKYGYSYGKQKR